MNKRRNAAAPHLLHVFPTYGHGGVQIRIATIINHFGARYRHTIFALDGNMAAAGRLDAALGVRLADPGIDKRRPVASLFRMRRILARERPDLLLTYNWGAVEWALVNRFRPVAPHVHLESGFGPDEARGQLPRRVRFRRFALGGIGRLVVPSHVLAAIARDIWQVPEARIRCIPNGVDCVLFGGAGDPAAAPGFIPRPGEIVVGTLAPLRPEKNLHRLIRAFAAVAPRFPAARLLIAGDGAERAGLEQAAAAHGIGGRTVFTGHVEAPHKVYPLMDIFAITSDTEQMPNTLIQAMAAARPVVGVDVGDVARIVAPENRDCIVDAADEPALARALEGLLADPEARARLSRLNRARVERDYSAETMFRAYETVFDEMLGVAAQEAAA